jgi:hypothetical protein
MRKRKHLQTSFLKYILEKYNKEENEINDEETNTSDEETIDNVEEIDFSKEKTKEVQKDKIKDDEDLDLDQLIKEYNKLTEKLKTKRNDILYKR